MTFTTWLQRNRSTKASKQQRESARRLRGRRLPPCVEALEDRTLLTSTATPPTIFKSLADGLDSQLRAIQAGLDSAIYDKSQLPFVGTHLRDAGNVVDGFRAQLSNALTNLSIGSGPDQVKDAVFQVLGSPQGGAPQGLGVLGDLTGDGVVNRDDVRVSLPDDGQSVRIDVRLTKQLADVSLPGTFAFNLGLPGIPLKVDGTGGVNVQVGFDYRDLGFSYATTSGFALDTSARDPLTIQVVATFARDANGKPASLSADLGFLKATVQDGSDLNPALRSRLNVALTVDIDTTSANLVRLDGLDGQADVYLQATASFNANNADQFPSFTTDFETHWGFGTSNPNDAPPTVGFKNVRMNVGSFLTSIIGPVVQDIKKALEPVQPVLDFLNAPIPGLSDLSHAAGKGDVTLLDLANAGAGLSGDPEIQAIVTAVNLVNEFSQIAGRIDFNGPGHDLTVSFGDFNVNTPDPSKLPAVVYDFSKDFLTDPSLLSPTPASFEKIQQQLSDAGNNAMAEGASALLSQFERNGLSYQLAFPIIDDPASSVFRLLLGQDANLVTFKANFKFDSSEQQSLDAFGVSLGFTGAISVDAGFSIGYDTKGIRDFLQTGDFGDFANGLYLDHGTHLSLGGRIGAGGSVGSFVALTFFGGIQTGSDANASNGGSPVTFALPSNLDKVRLAQLPDCFYVASGELDVTLQIGVQVGVTILGKFIGLRHSFPIASGRILDFTHGCMEPPPPPPPLLAGSLEPGLGVAAPVPDASGKLTLFMGPNAGLRKSVGNTTDGDEDFTVYHVGDLPDGSEIVQVFAFGVLMPPISGVRSIYADGGAGDNTIRVLHGVRADVELHGGQGHANLEYDGSGTSRLYAGTLASTLVGGSGPTYEYGGSGGDTLAASSRFVSLNGGSGDNTIIVQAPVGGFILGGTNHLAHNTLEVLEPQGSTITTLSPFGSGVAVLVQTSNLENLISLATGNITTLVLGGSNGSNTVNVGDLSETELQVVLLDVSNRDGLAFTGQNRVTVHGSAGADSLTASSVVDLPSGQSATFVATSAPGGKTLTLKVNGLRGLDTGLPGQDGLVLDGGGGGDNYAVFLSPTLLVPTTIQNTGPRSGDSLRVFGTDLPAGSETVTDSVVSFHYTVPFGPVIRVPVRKEVYFGGGINLLEVHAPDGGEVITAARARGTTSLYGGSGDDRFDVSNTTTYTLYGLDGADAYVINSPLLGGQATILDNFFSVFDTLVINDAANSSTLKTAYAISSNNVTRVSHDDFLGGDLQLTASVTFSPMKTVTVNTGLGTVGANYINVASTLAGTTTTINTGNGANEINVQGTGAGSTTTIHAGAGTDNVTVPELIQHLNAVAGQLVVQGNGATTLILDDRGNTPAYGPPFLYIPVMSSYLITNQSLTRTSRTQVINISNGSNEFKQSQASLSYANLGYLIVHDGHGGATTLDVQSTAGANSVQLALSGQEAVHVGAPSNGLDTIGNLFVFGGSATTLTLHDEGSSDQENSDLRNDGKWEVQTHQTRPIYLITGQRLLRTNVVSDTLTLEDRHAHTSELLSTDTHSYSTSIIYTDLNSVLIKGGDSENVFSILSTAAKTPVTINAGIGKYAITVGNGTTNLDGIGTLIVNGKAGTSLLLDDQANRNRREETPYGDGGTHSDLVEITTAQTLPTYLVSSQNVKRTNTVNTTDDLLDLKTQTITPLLPPGTLSIVASISYFNVDSVGIQGGASHNVFNVQSTRVGTPVTLAAGNVADAVNVGTPDNLLQDVNLLTVNGSTGTTLTLNDQANAPISLKAAAQFDEFARMTNPTYRVTNRDVTRTDEVIETDPKSNAQVSDTIYGTLVSYSQIASLVINGGMSSDTFTVQSTAVGTPVGINAGSGDDAIDVGSPGNLLDQIQGPLTIDGQGGSNTLTVNDQSASPGQTYFVTANTLARAGAATITYSNMQSLVLNAGGRSTDNGNVITVQSTATGTPVNIHAGAGGDHIYLQANSSAVDIDTNGGHDNVTLGLNGIMAGIGALVNVHDAKGTGSAALYVEDGSDPTPRVVTVNDGTLTGLSAGRIQWTTAPNASIYGGVLELRITGGTGGNTFNVNNTSAFYHFTLLAAGGGPNHVNIRGTTGELIVQSDVGGTNVVTAGSLAPALGGTLANINGLVYIWDQTQTALTLDDSGDTSTAAKTVTFGFDGTYHTVSGLAPATFYYVSPASFGAAGVSQLNVYGGTGPTVFPVQSTGAGTPVTINAGSGSNAINVGNALNQLDPIQGALTVNGKPTGSTALNVNDQGAGPIQSYFVTAGTLVRPGAATITYSSVQSLVLNASPGSGDVPTFLDIQSTAAGTALTANVGIDSQVSVQNALLTLDDIRGPATINGQTGDPFSINDLNNAVGYTYTLTAMPGISPTASRLTRSGAAPITYTGMNSLQMTGGRGDNTFNIESLANNNFVTRIYGGGGRDVFNVSPQAHDLDNLSGILDLQAEFPGQSTANASLTLNDQSHTAARNWLFDAGGLNVYPSAGSTAGVTQIYCYLFNKVVVNGGSGGNTINITGTPAGEAVTINGGGGTNTLVGPNTANTWSITGLNSGILGPVAFVNFQNLVGGTSTDAFVFHTGGSLSGSIDGQGGSNTLDYSTYRGNLLVNLPLGMATGVAGGIRKIRNVIGSIGNDLIVGDANPNVLIGGMGRNLIIGGAGADALTEVAANTGDNLLIGGTTDFDQNPAALNAIFAEWTRTDLGFEDRASDLLNGTNGQSATPLNRVNGQLVLLNNATAHADNAADTLTGGGKGTSGTRTGRNWFFVDAFDAIINFLAGKNGDKKTQVR